jgi:hypothetical protein
MSTLQLINLGISLLAIVVSLATIGFVFYWRRRALDAEEHVQHLMLELERIAPPGQYFLDGLMKRDAQ